MDEGVQLVLNLPGADGRSRIQLTVCEIVHERFPSVRFGVCVQDGNFSARVDAWVGRDELLGFLSAVEACERTRTGSARLVSLSPDELDLLLHQRDAAGHFAVRYEVGAYRHVRWGGVRQALAGEFELDAERFASFARDLREFIQQTIAARLELDQP